MMWFLWSFSSRVYVVIPQKTACVQHELALFSVNALQVLSLFSYDRTSSTRFLVATCASSDMCAEDTYPFTHLWRFAVNFFSRFTQIVVDGGCSTLWV